MIAVSSLKAMEVMETQVNRWLIVRGSWQSSHCRETSRSLDPPKEVDRVECNAEECGLVTVAGLAAPQNSATKLDH